MTRVADTDPILLLVREQLRQTKRSGTTGRTAAVRRSHAAEARPLERARALAALETLSQEEVERVVLRGILATELGEGVSNDPGFQGVVDRVLDILRDMPEGAAMMARAVRQVRNPRG